MKKALITGATSPLGIALVEQCVREGVRVVALVRKGSGKASRLPSSSLIDIRECELDKLHAFPADAARNCGVFFHLAWAHTQRPALDDPRLQHENIEYTLQAALLAQRLGCAAFVGVGSQAEYGRHEGVISTDAAIRPDTAYGVCKYAAGRLAQKLCAAGGIRFCWARVFSAYGPWDRPDTMISHCLQTLLRGEKPSLTPCGQMWDYIYMEDAARALLLIGETGRDGAVYNVGGGNARPLREYAEILRDCVDPALPLGIGERPYAPGQVMRLCADISALTRDTGFLPQISFLQGIQQTIQWYRNIR